MPTACSSGGTGRGRGRRRAGDHTTCRARRPSQSPAAQAARSAGASGEGAPGRPRWVATAAHGAESEPQVVTRSASGGRPSSREPRLPARGSGRGGAREALSSSPADGVQEGNSGEGRAGPSVRTCCALGAGRAPSGHVMPRVHHHTSVGAFTFGGTTTRQCRCHRLLSGRSSTRRAPASRERARRSRWAQKARAAQARRSGVASPRTVNVTEWARSLAVDPRTVARSTRRRAAARRFAEGPGVLPLSSLRSADGRPPSGDSPMLPSSVASFALLSALADGRHLGGAATARRSSCHTFRVATANGPVDTFRRRRRDAFVDTLVPGRRGDNDGRSIAVRDWLVGRRLRRCRHECLGRRRLAERRERDVRMRLGPRGRGRWAARRAPASLRHRTSSRVRYKSLASVSCPLCATYSATSSKWPTAVALLSVGAEIVFGW